MQNEKTLEEYIYVKDSEIHGYGIFTSIDIEAERKILVIKGEVINEEECIRREEEGNVYIFYNGDDNYIDVEDSGAIKYINHNCDCNCEVIDRDDASLYLYSIKNIKAGEELCIDYGYEEIYDSCKCDNCDNKPT
ncbi:MAG TPA: SET domain-containing protein [Ignavibacteriaceae bacterium]|nr:SET domain-containing protein [Ignavibacteriaceae bacterium]